MEWEKTSRWEGTEQQEQEWSRQRTLWMFLVFFSFWYCYGWINEIYNEINNNGMSILGVSQKIFVVCIFCCRLCFVFCFVTLVCCCFATLTACLCFLIWYSVVFCSWTFRVFPFSAPGALSPSPNTVNIIKRGGEEREGGFDRGAQAPAANYWELFWKRRRRRRREGEAKRKGIINIFVYSLSINFILDIYLHHYLVLIHKQLLD